MARLFRKGNISVYIYREAGGRHHRPHAHVKQGATTIATVYLETLDVVLGSAEVPDSVRDELSARQDEALDMWADLNDDQ